MNLKGGKRILNSFKKGVILIRIRTLHAWSSHKFCQIRVPANGGKASKTRDEVSDRA